MVWSSVLGLTSGRSNRDGWYYSRAFCKCAGILVQFVRYRLHLKGAVKDSQDLPYWSNIWPHGRKEDSRKSKGKTCLERTAKACIINPTSGHMDVALEVYWKERLACSQGAYHDVERIVSCLHNKHDFPHDEINNFFHEINKQQQVATCDVCQRVNTKLVTMPAELHPVSVHSPWHHAGIDSGPISPTSLAGNR